jgi:hypothetical protein
VALQALPPEAEPRQGMIQAQMQVEPWVGPWGALWDGQNDGSSYRKKWNVNRTNQGNIHRFLNDVHRDIQPAYNPNNCHSKVYFIFFISDANLVLT